MLFINPENPSDLDTDNLFLRADELDELDAWEELQTKNQREAAAAEYEEQQENNRWYKKNVIPDW
tara:strand:+ start:795 stop:989 length:195 start_codon:yes stop_codon:yes gene_type:complete